MKYERITRKDSSYCTFCEGIAFCRISCEHEKHLERLVELENKIENGEIIIKGELNES